MLLRSLLFRSGRHHQFLRHRRISLAFSAFLIIASVIALTVRGLNYGIDFSGGILVEIKTEGAADLGEMRSGLDGLGFGNVSLQQFGSEGELMIRLPRQEGNDGAQMESVARLRAHLGAGIEYRRVEAVGPKISSELLESASIAILLSLLGVLIYIWFRFELRFGLAALAALAHDVVLTFGFFSVTAIEFNLTSVAAILTIAGYSINDTVVIFDRVRENLRKFKKMNEIQLCDRSISETMSRTLLTSGTTLLAIFILTFVGGPVIAGFSIALLWGVVIGTYSSIFVALALLITSGAHLRSPEFRAASHAAGGPD